MEKKCIKLKLLDGAIDTFYVAYWNFLLNKLQEKFEIIISDDPQYVICGCFSNEFMKYDCIKIQVLGENITPDFNLFDYAIGFDYIDFEDRYIRYPIYSYAQYDFKLAAQKHLHPDEYFLSKNKFCNFLYSNNKWNDKIRNDFFNILSQYKRVDSGGRVNNNIGYYVGNKRQFQEQYKFSIAFENSRKNGYTTEKIMDAFAAGTIPIYWGNPLIVKEFNPKAFVNAFDYASLEDCAKRVAEIDQSEELYLEMQHEPIFVEDSIGKLYYDQPDLLVDFLADIFSKPYEQAKRIFNSNSGYNSEYKKIISIGWGMKMAYKKPLRVLRKELRTISKKK